MEDARTAARANCCETWPKPCTYHEGYEDGMDAAADAVSVPPLPYDLDAIEIRTNALALELPAFVHDDYAPRVRALVVEVRRARADIEYWQTQFHNAAARAGSVSEYQQIGWMCVVAAGKQHRFVYGPEPLKAWNGRGVPVWVREEDTQ